jgi:integrase
MENRVQDDNNSKLQRSHLEINNQIAEIADAVAARYQFANYQQRRSFHTLRRQRAGLRLFEEFLYSVGIQITSPLFEDPEAWQPITWGLVEGFVKWQLSEGYAIQSINVRLSTVKTYAKLAMKTGILPVAVYAQIATVNGYTHKEGIRVDDKRPQNRVGFKKEYHTMITDEQAALLIHQPHTPQGRRDRLMMCLLLDHGLRVGELSPLTTSNIDLQKEILEFYRPKVAKVQRHYLSQETMMAINFCLTHGEFLSDGPLLRRSLKNKALSEESISERGITHRVKHLGELIGIAHLSAHDCRHYWATSAARNGTDPFVLQEAGGWSSLAMPRRYIEDNVIANEGIKLNKKQP